MSIPIDRLGRPIRAALRRAAAASAVLLAAAVAPGCIVSGAVIADAERRFPDRGEHVDVPVAPSGSGNSEATVRLRYVERGSGAPIVLLHGAFGGLEDYEATILDGCGEVGRAIAFDRPGHGWSGRPCCTLTPDVHAAVLRDACRKLGIERPVLVGFSFGGAVAAAWASRWPDEVSGLVLLNAPTHPWGGAPDPVYALARTSLIGDAFLWNIVPPLGELLADSGAENAFAPDPVSPDFDRAPVPLTLRPSGFRANAEDLDGLDGALAAQCERYPGITCPVAFVVGAGDRIVGPEFHSPKFIVQVPQTERIVVPGAGHQLLYAHRDVCLDAVRRVLARR